jgi:hypothetical protein
MATPPDLNKFRLQVLSLKTARGDERMLIATIINEMMRAMRAPGHDEAEAAAILRELDLGTLSNLHDENAVSCRAEAVETLLAIGDPHTLGLDPKDVAYAESVRRPTAIRCPLCQWEHKGGTAWACDKCGKPMDTFASEGRCKHCDHLWAKTQCGGCKQWSPHFDYYVYDPIGPGEVKSLHARCPKCLWAHEGWAHWACDCGNWMNTFASRGLCSRCNKQWQETHCPRCHQWSAHLEWYAYGKPNWFSVRD